MTIEGINVSVLNSSVKVSATPPNASSDNAVTDTEFAETLKNQFKSSDVALNEDRLAPKKMPDKMQSTVSDDINTDNSSATLLDMLLPPSSVSEPVTSEQSPPLTAPHLTLPDAIEPSLAAGNQTNPAVMMTLANVTTNQPSATTSEESANTPLPSALTRLMPSSLNLLGMTDGTDTSPDSDTPPPAELQDLPDIAAATEQLSRMDGDTPQPSANTSPMPVTVEQKQELVNISKPLNHPGWSQDLGQQVVWLYNKAMPSAEISLNPEHLGPISIKIEVNQDDTSIQFSTPHLAVKEALEASIPKLREMLGTQQLNLVDVNIEQQAAFHHPQQQAFNQPMPDTQGQHTDADVELQEANSEQPTQIVEVNGLVSFYA